MGVHCWHSTRKGKREVSLEERTIIDQHTPPEIWLNKKGIEGWELVAVTHRHDYTEFFMKRRMGTFDDPSPDPMEKDAVSLAKQAEKYFTENDFEKALKALKQLRQSMGEKDR